MFGESDVSPRVIQSRRIGGPARGVILIETASKPPAAQRAGGGRKLKSGMCLAEKEKGEQGGHFPHLSSAENK